MIGPISQARLRQKVDDARSATELPLHSSEQTRHDRFTNYFSRHEPPAGNRADCVLQK